MKDGVTPLCIAAEEGDEDIVQVLLDKGANIDHSDEVFFLIKLIISFDLFFLFLLKDGITPLISAAENGFEEIVEILLMKGANGNCFTIVCLLLSFFFFKLRFFY